VIDRITTVRHRLQVILEAALAILTATLVLIVLWQVLTRYLLGKPSSWTDEAATVLLVWMVLIGAAIGFARRAHLGLDYFVGKLSGRVRAVLRAIVFALVALFAAAVMIYGGSRLALSAFRTGQVMPALQMRRGYFYLPLPVGGAIIFLVAMEGMLLSLGATPLPKDENCNEGGLA